MDGMEREGMLGEILVWEIAYTVLICIVYRVIEVEIGERRMGIGGSGRSCGVVWRGVKCILVFGRCCRPWGSQERVL